MANQGQRATMKIRIGKKTVEMRLITWAEGAALTSIGVEDTLPTSE